MDRYILKDGKRLKFGYTTGSCAAGATKAAVNMLLSKDVVNKITLSTPKGWDIELDIRDIERREDVVSCAVVKDGGDDPDNTHGMYIYSRVKLIDTPKIVLKGGCGIGKVTKKGLPVPVGQPAINPVPREMIIQAARESAKKYNYSGGFEIEISAPEGERVGKKTFNPRLGILGGISILGTTGIVEPMSEKALVESLYLELRVLNEAGHKDIILFPGNYGRRFASEELGLDVKNSVKISNYVGEVLSCLNTLNFENVLIISHMGKLIKVAGGIMNTHSKFADARMEILSAYCSACGGDSKLSRKILKCSTTDEAVELIQKEPFYDEVMSTILARVSFHIKNRLDSGVNLGLIMYTNSQGMLKADLNGEKMLSCFREKIE